MKVKIGNTIHDSMKEPIMLILSPEDKENIRKMKEIATRFLSAPEGYFTNAKMADVFMDVPDNTLPSIPIQAFLDSLINKEHTTGEVLVILRESRGFSEEKVAKDLDLTPLELARLENDEITLDKAFAEKLAKYHGITTNSLFYPHGKRFKEK